MRGKRPHRLSELTYTSHWKDRALSSQVDVELCIVPFTRHRKPGHDKSVWPPQLPAELTAGNDPECTEGCKLTPGRSPGESTGSRPGVQVPLRVGVSRDRRKMIQHQFLRGERLGTENYSPIRKSPTSSGLPGLAVGKDMSGGGEGQTSAGFWEKENLLEFPPEQ